MLNSKSSVLTSLGTRIRALRLTQGMTQNQLAFNCEFEKSSMSKIEAGQVQITIDEVRHATKTIGYASSLRAFKPTTVKRHIVEHFKREYPSALTGRCR